MNNCGTVRRILTITLLSAGCLLEAQDIKAPDDNLHVSAGQDSQLEDTNGNRAEETPNRDTVQISGGTKSTSTTPFQQSTSFRGFFRDLGSDFKHLPSVDSLFVAAVGGGLAIGVHPFESGVNQRLANDGGFFKAGNLIGNTATLMGASVATYGLGRATGKSRVAREGLDLLRAQIVTEAMTESLKYTVRRRRPDGSAGYAFPSGHAAMTFATATVVERHHGFRWAFPVYALATYVGMSRVHDNVHFLSDVVFGAAVGTIAGRTVTRHGRSNFAMAPLSTPRGRGIIFVYTW